MRREPLPWKDWLYAYKSALNALTNQDVKVGYLVACICMDRDAPIGSHVPLAEVEKQVREALIENGYA